MSTAENSGRRHLDSIAAPGAAPGSGSTPGETDEVPLSPPDLSAGWVLVEGRVGPRGRHLRTSLRLYRRSARGQADDIPLPILFDGRIHQLVQLPPDVERIAWRPPLSGSPAAPRLAVRRIGWLPRAGLMAVRVLRAYVRLSPHERRECGLSLRGAVRDLGSAYRLCTGFLVRLPGRSYAEWLAEFDALNDADRSAILDHIARFDARPRFHLLLAAGGAAPRSIADTLESLAAQLYGNFACTILDYAGEPVAGPRGLNVEFVDAAATPAWLETYNTGLARERADAWIMLLHAGDRLPPHSLYWFACEVMQHPGAALVYSDDDLIDALGHREGPRFKPEWSPTHLRSTHYVGAAAIVRGREIAAAGGIGSECCRHGNYALLLRVVDIARAQVRRVAALLFHRRRGAGEEPWENPGWCAAALRAHLARQGTGSVVEQERHGNRVLYRLPEPPPLVSILVPTRDAPALLRQCIDSVLEKTTYPRYEVLVIDNRTSDPEALAYLARIGAHPAVRVLSYDQPFNYSAINNFAAAEARGELLCLLNNDIEVISPDWLEEMAGHLLQPGIAAVGAKLYYPDGRIQHAGVAVGAGGPAIHLHLGLDRAAPGYCGRAAIAHELSAVTGACLLTRKRVYEEVGGLERRLKIGFNDIDYCLRLQEAGWRVVFTPHAELFHHESATRGDDRPLAHRLRARREVSYMRRRWGSRLRDDPYYNPNLSRRRADFSLSEAPRVSKPWRDGA